MGKRWRWRAGWHRSLPDLFAGGASAGTSHFATLLLIVLALGSPLRCWAQDESRLEEPAGSDSPLAVYQQANEAYEDGSFEEAVLLFESLRKQGVQDGVLFYNLGNAYFKVGELGRAIASYIRAHRLTPRDPDVQANLDFARSLRVDKIEVRSALPVWRSILWIHRSLSVDEQVAISSVLYLGLMVLLMLRILRVLPPTGFSIASSWVLAGLFAFSLLSLGVRVRSQNAWQGVVIVSEAQALSAPKAGSAVVFTLHEGTELGLVRERGEWLEVRIVGGLQGWMTPEEIEQL